VEKILNLNRPRSEKPAMGRHMLIGSMDFTVISNSKRGLKKGPLEVKKEQNHCIKVTYTGINWGVSETE
jgi:hypothetical protein